VNGYGKTNCGRLGLFSDEGLDQQGGGSVNGAPTVNILET